MRGKLNEKFRTGNLNAKKQLSRVRDRQKSLESRKREALVKLRNADLIKVENAAGHTARVTLLWRPD
jgi:hypothetical protein